MFKTWRLRPGSKCSPFHNFPITLMGIKMAPPWYRLDEALENPENTFIIDIFIYIKNRNIPQKNYKAITKAPLDNSGLWKKNRKCINLKR